MSKYVYAFKEGNKDMKNILGGKGANLAEMSSIGLPVPQGFTVTTEACNKYYKDKKKLSSEVESQIFEKLSELEEISGKKFGDKNSPLLVSVRSGARASMPGMMDTVLNLGLNDEVAEGFCALSENERFVYDSYRRFIQMFADVVMGFPKSSFERLFDKIKEKKNITNDTDLSSEDLKEVVEIYKKEYKKHAGEDFPSDPKEQLIAAITAVFKSWNNDRAITYRKLNDIPSEWGTAVNIQEMVYGNMGDSCGTGVAFTRNPATGEKKLYGEYLINAQGEDVVAGIRTPLDISNLKETMPACYDEFVKICGILENHYKDMQDMEFTIENGKLFMLQTRNGKRTAEAALRIAVELVEEKMIDEKEAIMKVEPRLLDQLLHPNFDEESLKKGEVITTGLAASPGAATGKIYFTAEDVKKASEAGVKNIILARLETSPEDIEGMVIAKGILTGRGGMTSHAAVVARGMGTCCVSGCSELTISEEDKTVKTKDGKVFKEGDFLSLDGSTGKVYNGEIKTVEPTISGNFEKFMKWVDDVRVLKVRANADNETDAKTARKFGAEGIGLCRTEHMFFDEARIFEFRKMITAETKEKREEALTKILPFQQDDFEKLFKIMDGYNVTIRYLDPPLHEFLPHNDEDIKELAEALDMTFEDLKNRVESLKEFNPMMGHRGCRLGVTYPEIVVMQTKAVINAAINVSKTGKKVVPEIMVPLIGDLKEFMFIKEIIINTINEIFEKTKTKVDYLIGTMIEIPRAALLADEVAKEAEFFSFGTNDLTQMTYGFSRDDAGKFLEDYYEKQIFEADPFAKIDQKGVGLLMEMAIEKGKQTRKDIKLGICGEHGGEPSSVEYCHNIGLSYVSCSPFRVPIARLSAAQAVLNNK